MSARVESALAAMAEQGSFEGFAADLERPGTRGVRRRIEVNGDGRVRVVWSGSVEGAPARTIGVRATTVESAELRALVDACRVAVPTLTDGTRGTLLRVQAGTTSASGSVPAVSIPALVAAFEVIAARAVAVAELSVVLVARREESGWSGTVRLSNTGTEPIVVPSPASAAREEILTLLRDGEIVEGLVVEGDLGNIVLAPNTWTEARLHAPGPGGPCTLSLRWAIGSPALDARHAAFLAPEGVLESAPA